MKILEPYREKIDSLDEKLVQLLAEREQIIHQVAKVKLENNIPAVLPARIDAVRENAVRIGAGLGADPHYIREIYTTIIQLSCDIEETYKK